MRKPATDVRDRGCCEGNQNSRQEKKPGGKRVWGKKEKREREKGKGQEKGCLGDKKGIREGKNEDEQVEEKLLIVSKMSC